MDKKLQFDYLRMSLRKRKRFSKWQKQEKSDELTDKDFAQIFDQIQKTEDK